ncbi:MAG: nucleoside deaminase [Gemmataceae bacterium]
MSELDHERHMWRAIDLAADCPERPFGAVIVCRDTGGIFAEGWNRSEENPLLHGEMDALLRLVESRRGVDATRLVLYTTAEPCPMCMGAILWTGIGKVVFGTSIRFLTAIGWKQIDIPAEEVIRRAPAWNCMVVGGVLEAECNELFLNAARAAPGR